MIFKLSVQGGETGLKNDGKVIEVFSGCLYLCLLLPDLSHSCQTVHFVCAIFASIA
jgi:hypothetical protein